MYIVCLQISLKIIKFLSLESISRGIKWVYCSFRLQHLGIFLFQVLVFDFGTELYVWQGKAVKPDRRKMGVKLARQLYEKGYDYSACDINPMSPLSSELSPLFCFSTVRPLIA